MAIDVMSSRERGVAECVGTADLPDLSGLWASGDYAGIIRRLQPLGSELLNSGNRDAQWLWADQLATAWRALGNLSRARDWHAYADLLRRLHSESASPSLLSHAGCDAFLAGDVRTAESAWWTSLLMELSAENWSGAADDWGNLGLLAGSQGEADEARCYLREALRLHARSDDQWSVGLDLLHLAQLAVANGRCRMGQRLAGWAGERFRRFGNGELAARAGHWLWLAWQGLQRSPAVADWN